jgi:hypothetical protein
VVSLSSSERHVARDFPGFRVPLLYSLLSPLYSLRRKPLAATLLVMSRLTSNFHEFRIVMALIIFEIQIVARVESADPLLPWALADASEWGSACPPLTSDPLACFLIVMALIILSAETATLRALVIF